VLANLHVVSANVEVDMSLNSGIDQCQGSNYSIDDP
jgi:hypothetical protein